MLVLLSLQFIISKSSKTELPLLILLFYNLKKQVKFHFVTKKSNGTVLDDSRKDGVPMELVLGKKFKLEVWEVIVQKMSLNEVSRFIVDKSLVPQYPFISKTLRDARKPPEERKHCCGMTIQNEGIGYEDLNELFTSPCDLEFIIGSIKNNFFLSKSGHGIDCVSIFLLQSCCLSHKTMNMKRNRGN